MRERGRSPELTVAICTRDRAAELARTLQALAATRVPAGLEWELLVVDNGSTDDTPEVLTRFTDRLPLRVVRERRPGLSVARNRAVDEAGGRAILWTDDDVTVQPDWIETYADAFARHPACGFFGGPIRASFAVPPPAWLRKAWPSVARLYAVREPPADRPSVTADYVPYGANFGIRRDVQRRYAYDPELGRRPDDLRSGEEWDVLQRALADGVRGRWIPATVEHRIGPERATRAFVLGVARAMGCTAETRTRERDAGVVRSVGLWRRYASSTIRYGVARLTRRPERWVPRALERARARGRLDGLRLRPGKEAPPRGPGRGEAP